LQWLSWYSALNQFARREQVRDPIDPEGQGDIKKDPLKEEAVPCKEGVRAWAIRNDFLKEGDALSINDHHDALSIMMSLPIRRDALDSVLV
jgi:hypothetical protein